MPNQQQSETTAATPIRIEERPGRALAVITRTATREKGFIFAKDVLSDDEYFIHVSGVAASLWPDLDDGDAITCKVTNSPKGARGTMVERATSEEQLRAVAEAEENRGNR